MKVYNGSKFIRIWPRLSFESKYDENKDSNIFESNLGNTNSLDSSTHDEDEDVDGIQDSCTFNLQRVATSFQSFDDCKDPHVLAWLILLYQ